MSDARYPQYRGPADFLVEKIMHPPLMIDLIVFTLQLNLTSTVKYVRDNKTMILCFTRKGYYKALSCVIFANMGKEWSTDVLLYSLSRVHLINIFLNV